jgi:hypothetical protein
MLRVKFGMRHSLRNGDVKMYGQAHVTSGNEENICNFDKVIKIWSILRFEMVDAVCESWMFSIVVTDFCLSYLV